MSFLSKGNLRAASFCAEHIAKYQDWLSFSTSCQRIKWVLMISPLRGSCTCGPIAFCTGKAAQRTTE